MKTEALTQADEDLAKAEAIIRTIAISDIREALELLTLAVSSVITAVEQLDSDIESLPAVDDVSHQVSHVRDSLSSLESRIERLEMED